MASLQSITGKIWVTDAPPGTPHLCPFTGFSPTGDSTIKVLDLRTGTVKDTIHNGGNHRADEVAFDPRHQIFIVANPADEPFPFVTLISTIPDANGHHHIIKKIFFDGGHGPMPWRSTLRTVSNSPLGILGPVISLWPSRRLDLARPLATAALWRSPPMGTRMI